jgi:phospholipase C
VAPDLGAALTLAEPTNLGPAQLEALPFVATPGEIARARLEPLNGMQEALTKLAAHLPLLSAGDNFLSKVQSHISMLKAMVEQLLPPSAINTRADALHFIKGKLDAFFRGC